MTIERRKVEPDTIRLIEGLRDTGYTFSGAIADILDNSLVAGADSIRVQVQQGADDKVTIIITDNGSGMTIDELENAMRYGSKEQPTYNSLSKFGLGLKTASTSFCRRLSLISRRSDNAPVGFACWDLDEVAVVGDWELMIGEADANDRDAYLDALEGLASLSGQDITHGTVVLWENVDRLLKTKSGEDAANPKRYLKKLVGDLRDHLAMVFQRYLDHDDARARNVRIWINEELVAPWDPFCAKWVKPHLQKKITYSGLSGEKEFITLRGYMLPPANEIADPEYDKAVRISNPLQGIYLYRENRLIEGPEWLSFGAADTHLNRLRVELSFPGELDEVFGIDVKKSKVHLDSGLVVALEGIIAPLRREMDNVARSGKTKKLAQGGTSTRPTEVTIKKNLEGLTKPAIVQGPTGDISIENNSGKVPIADADGNQTGPLPIRMPSEDPTLFVERREMLDNGALWEPFFAAGNNQIGVAINAGHDWYRKAYVRLAGDTNLVQSIEYLMFALAQAEANNTKTELDEVYKEFRWDVGQNLRKLVKEIPEPEFEVE